VIVTVLRREWPDIETDDDGGLGLARPGLAFWFAVGYVHSMGFGSYDESEQGKNELDVDEDGDDDAVDADGAAHEGSVEFEIGASNDELIDRLQEIKEN